MSHFQQTQFVAIRVDETSSGIRDMLFQLVDEDISAATPLRSKIQAEIAKVAEPGEKWLVLQTVAIYDVAELPQPKVATSLSVEYK